MSEQPPTPPPPPGDSSQPPSYPGFPPPPPPPYGGYGGYGAAPPELSGSSYRIGDAFGRSFRLFGAHAGPFLLIVVTVFVAGLILQGIGLGLRDSAGGATPLSILFRILGEIAIVLLSAALVKGCLDAVDGRPVTYGSMFEGWDKLQVLIAAVLVGVLTGIGLILFIIPGLIVAYLLWFTNFFVVDAQASATGALGRSVGFASQHVGTLLLTALLGLITLVVGAVLCGVGLLVAYPVAMLLAAQAFRQLQGRAVADTR